MAVFTELSDEDRNTITAAYGITSLSSVIGIADGDRETTYLFRTKDSELIVTLFENGAEPSDLERAFETMETLYRNGVPCPQPKRTVQGSATTRAADKLVAIVSFVSGSSTTDPDVAKCESLGRAMAQIHSILQRPSNRTSLELPAGPVHGALVHQNVFFLGNTVSGIINFRLRHDDVLISEIADVLVGWTSEPNGELNNDKAQALLVGYNSVRALNISETNALPAFVMASAARRYASGKYHAFLPDIAVRAYNSISGIIKSDLSYSNAL